jgi:hypothetical protein
MPIRRLDFQLLNSSTSEFLDFLSLFFVFIDILALFLQLYRGNPVGYPLGATHTTPIGYHSSGSLSSKKEGKKEGPNPSMTGVNGVGAHGHAPPTSPDFTVSSVPRKN